ncbi:uncharacterized protein N7498_008277 [Penicillium cinerascens]|uniref:Uncharacterized protein n=1 Tax=Penicillium cinerascens TaxID=70096 RepID=A0A9W9JED9_9EURO|nr:uncharacterized protein N7498_008277 [Penicillium cinerascens]KAJ5194839.1 hypothetical protein N7498_008277 [Penicillium cinerascens]
MTGIKDRREEKDNAGEIISRMIATVKTLLDAKPTTINSRDQYDAKTFHYALQIHIEYREAPQAIQALLNAHPSIDTLNSRNDRGMTALGEAIRSFKSYGSTFEEVTSLITMLLVYGANQRLYDTKGRNILRLLCM